MKKKKSLNEKEKMELIEKFGLLKKDCEVLKKTKKHLKEKLIELENVYKSERGVLVELIKRDVTLTHAVEDSTKCLITQEKTLKNLLDETNNKKKEITNLDRTVKELSTKVKDLKKKKSGGPILPLDLS